MPRTRKLFLSTFFFAALCSFGCKPRDFNSSIPNANANATTTPTGAFAADVTGVRHCPVGTDFIDSGSLPTKMYHWTNDASALTNPYAHLELSIRNANKLNAAGDFGASRQGSGLYLASDPAPCCVPRPLTLARFIFAGTDCARRAVPNSVPACA